MAEVLSRALGNQILGQPERDYNHADDSQYKELRAAASKEIDKAHQLSQQSQQAFKSGDKSQAHELSEQSKQHRSKGDDLNMQAAQWVFRANNADSGPDEIDLHGLFVKESLSALDARVHAGQQRGERELRVITGKGIHSAQHHAKLKPAVEDYCRQNGLQCHVDKHNTGVVVVQLSGHGAPVGQPVPGNNQNHYQSGPQGHQNQGYQQGHQQGHQQGYQQGGHQGGHQGGQNQDLVQKVQGWIRLYRQIRNLFRGCL